MNWHHFYSDHGLMVPIPPLLPLLFLCSFYPSICLLFMRSHYVPGRGGSKVAGSHRHSPQSKSHTHIHTHTHGSLTHRLLTLVPFLPSPQPHPHCPVSLGNHSEKVKCQSGNPPAYLIPRLHVRGLAPPFLLLAHIYILPFSTHKQPGDVWADS